MTSLDVLSQVLEQNPVRGVISGDLRLRAPWGFHVHQPDVAGFHLVVEGEGLLLMSGQAPLRVLQGDVVVVPNGAPHALVDDARTKTVPIDALMPSTVASSRRQVVARSQRGVHVACGAFRFARGTPSALLSLLPPLLHLRSTEVQGDELLRSTLRLLTAELLPGPFHDGAAHGGVRDVARDGPRTRRAGGAVLLDRLVDVLFIAVVRRWLDAQPAGEGGWLAALRDERIGRVLGLLYASPQKAWTVEAMAKKSGLSRAAFARRFQELVGVAPLGWLTSVRMELAAQLLTTSDESVASIAAAVGYESEFAFSRAFKRHTGHPPRDARGARRAA